MYAAFSKSAKKVSSNYAATTHGQVMKKQRNRNKKFGFKVLLGASIVLLILLLLGQTMSLLSYDWTVSLGLQESEAEVTLIGVAWLRSFALADTLVYIPLLLLGIIGLIKNYRWGIMAMIGSLAISAYWPVINLTVIYLGKNEINLPPEKYISFSILLPLITIYGLWGLWYLYRHNPHATLKN